MVNTIAKRNNFLSQNEFETIIRSDIKAYNTYLSMDKEYRQQLLDFLSGKISLPLTYDTCFKRIFDPYINKQRLEDFISSIIGKKVKVRSIIPNEDVFVPGGKVIILDIIVELEGGYIANVEIQKSPYNFMGERLACHSADLLLRQYSRLRSEKGQKFSYKYMKEVYVIVIYEKSTDVFKKFNTYKHIGCMTFDSGIMLNTLQKNYLIALDRFREISYHKDDSRLSGWLSLLLTETAEDVEQTIKMFPWLEDVYRDIAAYRDNPKEVFNMFAKMMAESDITSVNIYMEELENEVADKRKELANIQKELADSQKELDDKQKELFDKDLEITRLKALLQNK